MRFYLGTHMDGWLGDVDVPLFISRRRLARRARLKRARAPWALDSGGYSELHATGRWGIEVSQYAEEVDRWRTGIGLMDWAAPMDWMCEPNVRAKTGLTVQHHQDLTIANFLDLRAQLGPVIIPVLQGWELADYADHIADYAAAGIDLAAEPVVGVGSVCRRQQDDRITAVLELVADAGIAAHAFGVRSRVLWATAARLASADSMAWSADARMTPVLLPDHDRPGPGRPRGHINCANCLDYALLWRQRQLAGIE